MDQATPTPNTTPVDPPWMAYARTKRGIHEIVGDAVAPWIAHCFVLVHMAGAQDDTTAWCSAHMNGIMADTGRHYTESAAARSWTRFAKYLLKLTKPVHGCILVFSRPPDPEHGHVTLYDAVLQPQAPAGQLPCYGGNQHNEVCDAFYPEERLIGCYWPADYPLPEGAEVETPVSV